MDTLQQASDELAEIDEKIAALQQRREQLRAFINLGSTLFATKAERLANTPLDTAPTPAARVVEVAREIIRAEGPIHTRDLLAKLIQRGMHVRGPNQATNLSVTLSKSQQFESSRAVGWMVKPVEKQDFHGGEQRDG